MGKLINLMTMEFEELRKIWDTQNNKPMYVIDDTMIHQKVIVKKRKAAFRANLAEFIGIGANLFAASLIASAMLYKGNENLFAFMMMVAMFLTAAVIGISRARRKKNENRFDLSTIGELQHALANATYHVWFNTGLLIFAGLIVLLTFASILTTEKSLWILPLVVVFFGITGWGARWEHRCFVRKKEELELLMRKLEEETDKNS
ncbi:MAG: hypothetical protein AAF843_15175 [Bacteroidota bacterium]